MTIISVILMVIAAMVGLFLGMFLNVGMGGAILLALITGVGCIIHTMEKHHRQK